MGLDSIWRGFSINGGVVFNNTAQKVTLDKSNCCHYNAIGKSKAGVVIIELIKQLPFRICILLRKHQQIHKLAKKARRQNDATFGLFWLGLYNWKFVEMVFVSGH